MIRHYYCLVRDWLIRLLCDPCPCDKCAQEREIEWQAEELADETEAFLFRGDET